MDNYDWLEWFHREQQAEQAEAEVDEFDRLMRDTEEYGGEA